MPHDPATPDNRTVLVTGATGGQGGAVARRLLAHGWGVLALVRDPDTRRAKELEALGAELVTGDLDDAPSLRAAARGVHGVFSVQPADMTAPHPEAEVRQGRNVADAAASAGVAHLVYSSVGAAGRKSGVAHFDSKTEIEAYVGTLSVPTTVLRPVFFMENWLYLLPEAENGERVGSIALDADIPLQMIALADIGRIAAEAFDRPAEFIGRRVEIAGDQLTVRQVAGFSAGLTTSPPASSGSRSRSSGPARGSWRRCSTGSRRRDTGPTSPRSARGTRGC
ncbi:NmrA/HSCARG family protein [Streptomyces sp. NPDC058653]|uniref:NmrA/HSCARG family protein n=1 Tax=Streptomyces sp. NPDC058653 TaxID=3346576 RepID=UPI00364BFBFA